MTALRDFYGLTTTPFTKSIDSDDLYASRGHREIQGRLAFALQERLPALLTGDVGTGKTAVVVERVKHLLATDPERFRVAVMGSPKRERLAGFAIEVHRRPFSV